MSHFGFFSSSFQIKNFDKTLPKENFLNFEGNFFSMLDENFSLFYVKIFFMALRVVDGVFGGYGNGT
jgi:hypothetical protein